MRRRKKCHKTVDLHGLRHERARWAVIRAIEEIWDSGQKLEIVTGNSERMKEIVREVLSEYDLEPQEGIFRPGHIDTVVE